MKPVFFLCGLLCCSNLFAQNPNPIITAFPSLTIPVTARGLGMGDAGIAIAEGAQGLFYNPARTAFTHNFHEASVSYVPWLSGISRETRMMNASWLASTGETGAFGLSLNYFDMGTMKTIDANGATVAAYRTSEFSLTSSYALRLSEQSAISVGLKLLNARHGQVLDPSTFVTIPKSVLSFAGDIGYYQRIVLGEENNALELGMVLQNIGPKIAVEGSSGKTFLPTILGIGLAYSHANKENGNHIVLALDVRKLLVPTPPLYDNTGMIMAGKDPDRSVLNALFSSFGDAPGGVREELQELRTSVGAEFSIAHSFFLRSGISLEHKLKGNRKFVGVGAGYTGFIGDQSWKFDLYYLLPVGSAVVQSPFRNSLGITIGIAIGNFE